MSLLRDLKPGGLMGRRLPVVAAALTVLAPLFVSCSPAAGDEDQSSCHVTCVEYAFAVTGDFPSSDDQRPTFRAIIQSANADPDIKMIAHLGDIKGGQKCDTDYYREIRADFNDSRVPLVYTPGDNEWSDCSLDSAGGYDPIERLSALRDVFFDDAGRTLGSRPEQVASQADSGYPENVRLAHAGVTIATFHTVGPLNGLGLWQDEKRPTSAQKREVAARTAAAVEHIEASFNAATQSQDKAVILMTQADMFPPAGATGANLAPYRPIVQAIARGAVDFQGTVHLFNGHTHELSSDQPLATDSKWLTRYRVPAAENFARVTIAGDENVDHYLKVAIRPGTGKVVRWTRIPLVE